MHEEAKAYTHAEMREFLAELGELTLLDLAKGGDVTSRSNVEIYDLAAQRQVIVHNLTAAGRGWTGQLQDGLHPERRYYLKSIDAATVKDRIEIFAGRDRAEYAAGIATEPDGITPAEPVTLELPADDSAAYEAGYNEGLNEGLRLAGEGIVTDRAAVDMGVDKLVAEAVEQARREERLAAHAANTEANKISYEDGYKTGLKQGREGAKKGADGLRKTLEAVEKVFVEMAAHKATVIDLLAEHAKGITTIASAGIDIADPKAKSKLDGHQASYRRWLEEQKKANGVTA